MKRRIVVSLPLVSFAFALTCVAPAESAPRKLVPPPKFTSTALAVDAAGNSVLEPEETVVVAPTWRNDTGVDEKVVTGTATAFAGPHDAIYTIFDASADYGGIAVDATASCTAGGDCFGIHVSAPANRRDLHWDSNLWETLSSGDTKAWTLHVGESFNDVPRSNPFYRFVETVLHRGITAGCDDTNFCPSLPAQRGQMAVFVLVAKEGAGYAPPACNASLFNDVSPASPFCPYIEELARRGVVTGCGDGNFCPSDAVTREQMSVFVLRTLDPSLDPPACNVSLFNDVSPANPFCRWVEELARRGVVSGCGGGNYCPGAPVTREQMGVFLGVTFGLTLYGP